MNEKHTPNPRDIYIAWNTQDLQKYLDFLPTAAAMLSADEDLRDLSKKELLGLALSLMGRIQELGREVLMFRAEHVVEANLPSQRPEGGTSDTTIDPNGIIS